MEWTISVNIDIWKVAVRGRFLALCVIFMSGSFLNVVSKHLEIVFRQTMACTLSCEH